MLIERIDEWKQNVLLEGEQIGRQQGEATMLLRLLEHRFGKLSRTITDRVRAADITQLEHWGLLTLDAGSLDEVLGEPPA